MQSDGRDNGNPRLARPRRAPCWRSPHQSPLTAYARARAASSVRGVQAPITYNVQGHRPRVAVLVSAAPAPWKDGYVHSCPDHGSAPGAPAAVSLKGGPLASLRQRMAEKRAEIDANLSPSARAGTADDDDAADDDAATDQAFPPQPPPPVSTEPPMKSVELALDDFDVLHQEEPGIGHSHHTKCSSGWLLPIGPSRRRRPNGMRLEET